MYLVMMGQLAVTGLCSARRPCPWRYWKRDIMLIVSRRGLPDKSGHAAGLGRLAKAGKGERES